MLKSRFVPYLLVVAALALPAAAKRGITAEDYFAFEFVSDAHISPDAKLVAYVQTTIDQKANRRRTSVWVVDTDGKTAPRRLTAESNNSNAPRWSPDGAKLAFLSSRGEPGGNQIWILPMNGGEALQLTHVKSNVAGYQWSPDGKRFLLLSRTGPTDDIAADKKPSDVRHYKHITYKFNDTGWYDDKRSHIWVAASATGAARQLTQGDDWNDTDPQWSPDSTRIAFVSDRTGKEYDDSHNKEVWVIPADGGQLTRISDHEFEDGQPRWSPDGKQIAFTGQTTRRQFQKIYIASSTGGSPSQLVSSELDLIPGALRWGPGGKDLRFQTGFHGTEHIFSVDVASGKVAQVTKGERAVQGFDLNEMAGVMSYISNDFRKMDDV